jgi:hypothetical protein
VGTAHQQLNGPVDLVWGGAKAHVSRAMRELIAARSWLTDCQLPPYASELKPVEAVLRMKYRPDLLDGFLAKTRLDLSNPRY